MPQVETKPEDLVTDPGIREFLAQCARLYPDDAVDHPIAEQRTFYERLCAHFRKPRPASIRTADVTIEGRGGGLRIRVYRPGGADTLPAMLYLHGGGYILGSLDTHDDICAELADGAGIGVVAVDYRLAPEHPFPAAFEDACVAFDYLYDQAGRLGFDANRIIIGGDSAGGNLGAAVCLARRDGGKPMPKGQVLIYPGLGGDLDTGSYVTMARAPGLTTDDVRYYSRMYVGPDDHPDQASKFAYPLLETDYTSLPPGFLVACEIDPLHDDCFDFAARLTAAGGAAMVRAEPLLPHAFLRARDMSLPAAESFTAIVEAVRSLAHDGRLPSG